MKMFHLLIKTEVRIALPKSEKVNKMHQHLITMWGRSSFFNEKGRKNKTANSYYSFSTFLKLLLCLFFFLTSWFSLFFRWDRRSKLLSLARWNYSLTKASAPTCQLCWPEYRMSGPHGRLVVLEGAILLKTNRRPARARRVPVGLQLEWNFRSGVSSNPHGVSQKWYWIKVEIPGP